MFFVSLMKLPVTSVVPLVCRLPLLPFAVHDPGPEPIPGPGLASSAPFVPRSDVTT